MIGLYIVDGILIAGMVYLCCSPYKKYNFDEPNFNVLTCRDEDEYKEFSNYLSFNDTKVMTRELV